MGTVWGAVRPVDGADAFWFLTVAILVGSTALFQFKVSARVAEQKRSLVERVDGASKKLNKAIQTDTDRLRYSLRREFQTLQADGAQFKANQGNDPQVDSGLQIQFTNRLDHLAQVIGRSTQARLSNQIEKTERLNDLRLALDNHQRTEHSPVPQIGERMDRTTENVESEQRVGIAVQQGGQMTSQERQWKFHGDRLAQFQSKHEGERCFIIGNGPSLKDMDLRPLRTETTFGLNRIYLLFDKIGFPTTYHVSINRLVIEQCANEIQQLPTTKFVKWESKAGGRHWTSQDWLDHSPDLFFINAGTDVNFSHSPIETKMWEGGTVTYVAMQLAYFMGFSEVVLIGVDHRFVSQGPNNQEIVSEGDDLNHFDPNYFGKGFRWQLPDLETSELAYEIAKWRFEGSGRRIVDATVNGALQVFNKVDYEEVLHGQPIPAP
jgi:hypothetical protein